MTRETRGMATRILFCRVHARMSEHPIVAAVAVCCSGKCQVESVIVVDGEEGRHWKTEKGPRTSTDPLLPNPFSLPEMTERVKNNGSGRAGAAGTIL